MFVVCIKHQGKFSVIYNTNDSEVLALKLPYEAVRNRKNVLTLRVYNWSSLRWKYKRQTHTWCRRSALCVCLLRLFWAAALFFSLLFSLLPPSSEPYNNTREINSYIQSSVYQISKSHFYSLTFFPTVFFFLKRCMCHCSQFLISRLFGSNTLNLRKHNLSTFSHKKQTLCSGTTMTFDLPLG